MVAKHVRLSQWAKQIQSCNNRPEGRTVNEWCEQNHITKANYYWRMKQVRIACLDAMEQKGSDFVGLPVPVSSGNELTTMESDSVTHSVHSSAVIRTENGINIELSESASAEFIQKLLGVIAYVK